MKIHFLGGAYEVGKSAFMVETRDVNVLLDCGVKINHRTEFPLMHKAKRPHAIALSHAHLDHSGYIPALFKRNTAPILCTFPTIPLVQLLLEDTLKINEYNRETPYFSRAQLRKMLHYFRPLSYHQPYAFHDGSEIQLSDAGHILGSAQIEFKSREGRVWYTGDLNTVDSVLHSAAAMPKESCETLITESTYGGRGHPNRKKLEKTFCNEIRRARDDGFVVLIPAFAIGRTQELVQMLYANGLADYVYADGMGTKANEISAEFPSYLRDGKEFAKAYQRIHTIKTKIERKRILKRGNIILATAGMLEGGPMVSHIENVLRTGMKAKLLLTGFQATGTNGRLLMEEGQVRLNGQTMKWPFEVQFYDFSAHTDQAGLVRHVKKANPEKVFCVHGDPDQLEEFVQTLKEEGFNAYAPKNGERISV
ncbi:MBL fold metallo-hydrolase [Candidatus Micrarchaeota archaeon]|nr:MBL fold metallo-hydrolase [Candidatus Micrarchaeota archaeon]